VNNEALPESKELLNLLLTNAQKEIVGRAIKEIKENPESYNIDFFWELDASIGGIGGYCMQFNPTSNPFPSGIGRSLFRPLQYASSYIERNKDIHNNAKWVVLNSGLHLEAVAKYMIEKITSPINPARYKKFTLGRSIDFIKKKNALPTDIIEKLDLFLELYNKSKHDVNQDEERERLFSPADALIAYISARILGKELLRPYCPEILKSIEKYLGRLKGLNLNL
jgi:hypothetical protein